MLLWDRPDDGLGFERYLESQEIPVIHIPFVKRSPDERVPEPEPKFPCGAAWEPEDDATRLARMLQCEEMRTEYLWRDLDRMTAQRDMWQRLCWWGYAIALAAVLLLAAVWR